MGHLKQIRSARVSTDKLGRHVVGLVQDASARIARQRRLDALQWTLIGVEVAGFCLLGIFLALEVVFIAGGAMAAALVTLFVFEIAKPQAETLLLLDERQIYADAVVKMLKPEFDPRHKVELYWDPRGYRFDEKHHREHKSEHGNRKTTYRDVWFELQGVLLDGTQIRLRMRDHVVHGKHGVQKRRRDLFLRVRIQRSRHKRRLKKRFETLMKEWRGFERIELHSLSRGWKLKVVRLDHGYNSEEVTQILAIFLDHIHR